MANQQLNIKLGFQAETAEAKKAIDDLGKSLRKIQVQPQSVFDDRALRKASQAAQDLEKHLFKATNVNTGKLDLNKFSQSLTNSKQDLQHLCADLRLAGADGEKAFLNLVKNINKADSSTLNLGSKLENMLKTLKNTARWELSSNIVHGFESAISSAYGYAQDLNKSLNDIRIVTGRNIDQMSQFAEAANKAARALSTTTTDYTNASLIYFQQGLSNKEVEERTNVTIKMANAAGVSAQTVSDQMTAIWNNFDNGSKSLEYYADVITNLGAATASSTDEISQGLNKFAAIADTVGLSYEYATAALATVTSETRESADIVGNAYKTLFARIQGLQQGDTLDDGTTLNKYSSALGKIGINIKDTNGQLKDMDTILNEMGEKWNSLAKDQQLALAQTVAGVRQYSQLVALMDNWQAFQKNLTTAYASEGTLEEQAEIYAESWEAASERVEVAMQGIYKTLINDEFFIDVFKVFEGIVSGVDNIVQGVGGLKNILLIVSSIFLKQYAKEIPDALGNLKNNFEVISGKAEKNKIEMLKQRAAKMTEIDISSFSDEETQGEIAAQKKISEMNYKLAESARFMSKSQIEFYKTQIKNIELYGETASEIGKEIKALKELGETRKRVLIENSQKERTGKDQKKIEKKLANVQQNIADVQESKQKADTRVDDAQAVIDVTKNTIENYKKDIEDWNKQSIRKRKKEKEQKKLQRLQQELEQEEIAYEEQMAVLEERKAERDAIKEELTQLQEKEAHLIEAKENKYTKKERKSAFESWQSKTAEVSKLQYKRERVDSQIETWKKNALLSDDNTFEKQKQKMIDFLKELKEAGIFTETQFNELANELDNIVDQSIPDLIQKFEELATSKDENSPFAQWDSQISAANTELNELHENLLDMNFDRIELSNESERLRYLNAREDDRQGTIRRINTQDTNIDVKLLKTSEMMGAIAANALELWSALSMLQGLGDIWKDENLTDGQKFLQIISALIPVATMFGTVLNDNNRKQLTAVGTTLLHKISLIGTTAATTGVTVATKVFSKSLLKLQASLAPIGIALLVIVAAMGAVALAVWGVTSAFKAIQASSPEGKLKAVKEQARELNNIFEDATNAANKLKDAFNQYDSATKTLEECTKNTQEWNEALQNVNNQVLSLLQTYPELATITENGEKAIDFGKDGQLQIANWAKEKFINQANQNVLNTQMAAIYGQQNVREAEINKANSKARQDVRSSVSAKINEQAEYYAVSANNTVSDTVTREKIINYLVQNADTIGSMSLDSLTEDLTNLFEENAFTENIDTWVQAVIDLQGNFNELSAQIEINNAATKTENEILARQILANKENVVNSNHLDEIAQISGQNLDAKIDAELAGMKSWGKDGISKLTGVNTEARDRFEEYAKAANITNYDLIDTTGTDEDRNFVYTNSDGDKVTVSLTTMKQVVASSRASAEIAKNAESLVESFATKSAEEISAMTAAVTKNVNDLTVNQASGKFNINDFANNLSESDLTAMGYEGDLETMRAAYIKAYNEIAAKAGDALTDVIDDYSISVQNQLNTFAKDGIFDQFTIKQVDTLGYFMQEALINGGQDALNNLSNLFTNISAEQQGDFINALNSVDWSSATINDLRTALEDTGIQASQFAADDLQKLIDSMRNASEATQLSTEKFAALSEVTKDLKIGDIISADDFKKFETYGIEADNYFTKMADGTYKLTADAEDFYNIIKQNSLKEFETNIKTALDSFNAAKNVASNVEQLATSNADAKAQLDFLDLSGFTDTEQINKWRDELEQGILDQQILTEAVAAHIETIGGNEVVAQKINEALNSGAMALQNNIEQYLSIATSLDQLNQITSQLNTKTGLSIDGSDMAYQEALVGLASQYKNCESQINAYREALSSSNQETINASQATLELSIRAGELAAKYDIDADALEIQANYLKQNTANAELSKEQLIELAAANQRMNKGIATLHKNWSEWNKALKKADKTSMDYAKTVADMTDALVEITGALDDSVIPFDFFDASTESGAEHLEWMGQAAKGNIKAINLLGNAVGELTVKSMEMDNEIASLAIEKELFDTNGFSNALDAFEGYRSEVLEGVTTLQEAIRNGTLEAGEDVTELMNGTNKSWVDSLNQMAIATGMSVNEMNSLLNQLGVQAEVTTTDVPQKIKVPMYEEKVEAIPVDGVNGEQRTAWVHYTVPMGSKEVDGIVQVAQIKAEGNNSVSDKAKVTWTGTSGSSGGGGVSPSSTAGKGKAKKAKEVKKSEVVKRYKEINDALDDVTDAMEDASKAADRLYGKGRLDLMKKNNDLLKQEIELTRQKKEEALEYLNEDLDAMFKAASKAGVILTTDENGLITNYTEAMTKLYEELNAEITKANKDGNADENEQTRIDKIQERIDNLQDAIDQYDETRELIEDLDNELDEKLYQWQDNNYEMLTYELEIKLDLNEDELKLIDYYLNKISDDFYQMAEAAALTVGDDGVSQLEMYTSSLSNYEDYINSLKEAYANGEISQTAYIEGLREAQDGMLSNLESLNDLDKTMMHYYGETLSMAAEELANYVDHMEHLTEVLDHYQSLMEIMGKSTDYETMGLVLEGKAKALSDQAVVAKATMEMYKDEAEDRYQAYQQALLDGDEAAADLYLQQYKDALAAADEAEQEYLASAEEWAEALTAVLENKLSKFGQTLENALTGGTSFDQMTTAMERAASLQEEYLTTTNKIYETNKLMRQAQQEIDKTSNSVAKRRLKSFIEETYQLQNQAQLSNYELEIQQAKYDLLLAEIALEEAQNAKSIVRLQRDSEGNFGYVYTADSAAVAEAEQEVLDKQNNLYNIALQGANDYSQKYQQTLNEMYDTLADLQQQYLEGSFESEEEYHAAVEAAKKYYYDKLQQYSSLHTVAITLDSRVINDAWSTGFNDMLTKTEEWMEAVDIYLDDVSVAFMEWSELMDQVAADTGTDLDNLEENVKDIVDESKALKDILIGEDGKGGVVGAIETEIEAVKDITEMYATLRSELDKVKSAYEEVTAAINATIRAQSQISSNPGTSTTKYNSSSGGKQGSASEGASSGGSGGGGSGSGGSGGGTTDSGIRINLYATNDTNAKMGSMLIKKNSKDSISFGTLTHLSKDKKINMMSAYGPNASWSAYVTEADRKKIQDKYGFATGGYTGNWGGSYGKLAFLHQKELILNKGDTENFLASMEVLERILQVIDLHSASSQIGGILSSPILGNTGAQDINQHISIEANFPNATDRFEIEEAFKSMANLASQYANRK